MAFCLECKNVEMSCLSCLAENWFCMSSFLSLAYTKFCTCLSSVRHWCVIVTQCVKVYCDGIDDCNWVRDLMVPMHLGLN